MPFEILESIALRAFCEGPRFNFGWSKVAAVTVPIGERSQNFVDLLPSLTVIFDLLNKDKIRGNKSKITFLLGLSFY